MQTLRDGSVIEDYRLDRLQGFDARSRKFPVVRELQMAPMISKIWSCDYTLDQKKEGACVGFAIAHELLSEPTRCLASQVNDKYAKEVIYWGAQKIDQFEGGAYPGAKPVQHGTTVLAGAKTVKALGWIDRFEWSFGMTDLILGIGYKGPAVLGIAWYDSMYKPDGDSFVWPSKGEIVGGHAILAIGVNVEEEYFILKNSWGHSWGRFGTCKIKFDELKPLMRNNGEAMFFAGRKSRI